MELKDLGLQRINLDLINNITENFFAKEGDVGTRGLSIKVLNNSVDTTGISITMFAKVGKEVYSVDAIVKDASKGEYELIYPTSILKSGIVYAELQLKKLDNIISTKKFKILIESGIVTDSAIEGHDSYPLFEQLLEAGANEVTRIANEEIRKLNETDRLEKESTRETNESNRKLGEDERDNRELERASNESTRIADEISRIENESARESNETTRENSESTRDSSEIARENNELVRDSNDITREQNESTRQQNENTRIANEEIRKLNEIARVDAESARAISEQQRDNEFIEKIDDFVAETERVEAIYPTRLTNVETDLATHKEDYVRHLNDNMPHQFRDLKNEKVYNFGFQISAEGNPQIIYEEVIE